MAPQLDVIIIGAGTAALAAAGEVKKVTDRFLMVTNGVYGTTCVRTGCMPSKAFIRAAQLYHARTRMAEWGIGKTGTITVDIPALLAHVRALREHFLEFTLRSTERYRAHIVEGEAYFLSPNSIRVNKEIYTAGNVILATGSSPIIPDHCHEHAEHILTTDTLFEQKNLPDALGVLGLSVLGAEMAQAFAQLGIRVSAQHESGLIGGLTDPEISDYAATYLGELMEIELNRPACMPAKTLFVAQSREANIHNMGLEACGIITSPEQIFDYDPKTMQVGNFPLFIAGDVKPGRSILSEAMHEGQIAGYNAARPDIKRFRRRTALQIAHTDPVIAIAGACRAQLPQDVLVGKATYNSQGCATLMGKARGILHIYADKENHRLLGAELFAPGGEHLAHMLAWLIDRQVTLEDALELPFYHPSLEEGLHTALESMTA